jgi:hypothetical protein
MHPSMQINDDYYECLTPKTTVELLEACKQGQPPQMGRWGSLPMNGQVSAEAWANTIYYPTYLPFYIYIYTYLPTLLTNYPPPCTYVYLYIPMYTCLPIYISISLSA